MTRLERLRAAAAIAYLLAVGAVVFGLVVVGVLLDRLPGAGRLERAFESFLAAVLDVLFAPFDALDPPD